MSLRFRNSLSRPAFNAMPTLEGFISSQWAITLSREPYCANSFAAEIVGTPAILEIVSRKASARTGRKITAIVVDITKKAGSSQMEKLMDFGRAHPDIVKIRNQ